MRICGFLTVSWTASLNTVKLLLARMAVPPRLRLTPLSMAAYESSASWSQTRPAGGKGEVLGSGEVLVWVEVEDCDLIGPFPTWLTSSDENLFDAFTHAQDGGPHVGDLGTEAKALNGQ